MKTIEEVQIPLLVVPPPESCRLVDWHVRDGSRVMIGEAIFDLEVQGIVWSVESFHTGYIKINATAGSEHKVGDSIGSIVCDVQPDGYMMIGIDLPHAQIARIDALRGSTPRRTFLSKLICDTLEENPCSEQAAPCNPYQPPSFDDLP